ncbi:MAG: 3-deoxy-D-manno-octulosonic acid transferase, partial [Pseudomonadota bacterium]
FSMIITQSKKDKLRFDVLGGKTVLGNNIKFNAAPLEYTLTDYNTIETSVKERPLWVYASSHEGEEELAARVHRRLQNEFPELLTIIVPRHPDRSDGIERTIKMMGFSLQTRGENKDLPQDDTEIYLANTLGELGLFYKLSDIALIGRSFSRDGGGGHNPVEAAQHDCIVLSGPKIQFQHSLFDPMIEKQAAMIINNDDELYQELFRLFSDETYRQKRIEQTQSFIHNNDETIDYVIDKIRPYLSMGNKKAS